MTKIKRMTYLELKCELMANWDPGDRWGSAMAMFFDVCAEMYQRSLEIPAAWQYKPGLSVERNQICTDQHVLLHYYAEDESLVRLGRALNAYTGLLRRQGEDY